jgi:hypothetical protein
MLVVGVAPVLLALARARTAPAGEPRHRVIFEVALIPVAALGALWLLRESKAGASHAG